MNSNATRLFCLTIFLISLQSCVIFRGPGYEFELFEGTPVEELAKAVRANDVDKINYLIQEKGYPVDYLEPKFQTTLLTFAIIHSRKKAFLALLENGADPNLKSGKRVSTPFMDELRYALRSFDNCNTYYVKTLLEYGADPNTHILSPQFSPDGARQLYTFEGTALIAAIESKKTWYGTECLNITKLLVEAGADINQTVQNGGYGSIPAAIIFDHMKILRYLVIEKEALIPEHVYEYIDGSTETLSGMLNKNDYSRNPPKQKIKEEILAYLQSIGKE